MTCARWETIKTAFLDISPLSEPARETALEAWALRDAEGAEMVRQLLATAPEEGPDIGCSCWVTEPAPAGSILENGRTLAGRFEILSFLGSGGAGEVYRTFDREQREFVAVKVLRPDIATGRQAQPLLRSEVQVARLVSHHNVCRLHEYYPAAADDSSPFITMELVSGRTLEDRIREGGRLELAEAGPIVSQMLDGLEAAHLRGVIHRDFKAANIMLSEGGRVVLMDFGLARDIVPGPSIEATITSSAMAGTVAYMPPEQLRGQPATIAADIHALGVVLFEILTGARPFDGNTPIETAARRLNEVAPRPLVSGRPIDPRWEAAILQCLESEAEARPSSVADVRRILTTEPRPVARRRRELFRQWRVWALATASILTAATLYRQFPLSSQVGPATPPRQEAFDHYMRGRQLFEEHSTQSAHAALGEFATALRIDPQFALAMSAAADTHLFLKKRANLEASRRLAEQSVQTDPQLAEAHNSLAAVRQSEWRWREAEASYREALRLKPGSARIHRWYAGFLLQFARFEEALMHTRLAMEQDPHDRSMPAPAGLYFFFAGQYREALKILEPAVRDLDTVSKSDGTRFNLGQVYAWLGK
ncbi:MAG: protein kinase, partial [Bryobacterales bacterium]|nr:protein kinase [Bryobacterales bacterium]